MMGGWKAGLCLQQQQADAPSVVWDAGAESRREGQQCRGDAGSRVTASWCPPVGTSACPLTPEELQTTWDLVCDASRILRVFKVITQPAVVSGKSLICPICGGRWLRSDTSYAC